MNCLLGLMIIYSCKGNSALELVAVYGGQKCQYIRKADVEKLELTNKKHLLQMPG